MSTNSAVNCVYGATLALFFATATLASEVTDAKKEAQTATCKTEQLEKDLKKAKEAIEELRKIVEALQKKEVSK